jgi:two-component system, NarL family, nitrate/nitrite response regulator NarL
MVEHGRRPLVLPPGGSWGDLGLTHRAAAADEVEVSRTTVVIARFEDLVGLGLRALLADEEHVEVVAADVVAERLDAALAAHRPSVALVNFGSLRAATDVHRLHAAHPATSLVVLANRPTPTESNQLLAFGASACLSKDTQARDVVNAINLASRGLRVLPRATVPDTTEPDLLTRREADVLEHLRAGRSNAEIGLALHVSVETVRTHRRNIYRKLGVRTRRELAALMS